MVAKGPPICARMRRMPSLDLEQYRALVEHSEAGSLAQRGLAPGSGPGTHARRGPYRPLAACSRHGRDARSGAPGALRQAAHAHARRADDGVGAPRRRRSAAPGASQPDRERHQVFPTRRRRGDTRQGRRRRRGVVGLRHWHRHPRGRSGYCSRLCSAERLQAEVERVLGAASGGGEQSGDSAPPKAPFMPPSPNTKASHVAVAPCL